MPNSSLGERNLRHRLIGKDLDALGEVYGLYAAVVYGVAMKVTNGTGAAEEVTRAVFLELWRQPERFDPDQSRLRPYRQVAAELGIAEDVVKSRMYSGLRGMADALHPAMDADGVGLETSFGP